MPSIEISCSAINGKSSERNSLLDTMNEDFGSGSGELFGVYCHIEALIFSI
jgi:hypothetical protein